MLPRSRRLAAGQSSEEDAMSDKIELLKRELKKIETLPRSDLRRGYRKYYGGEAPECFGHDLLRRAIAHAIEERIYGVRLPRELERSLIRLAEAELKSPGNPIISAGSLMTMRPGTEFVRVWQGTAYKVVVVEGGFLWKGETWNSLSEIARTITGTRWNGPRFFGLRETMQTEISERPPPQRRGSHLRSAPLPSPPEMTGA
jgi:hypothetical protein